jgi:uncharacterized OsmC-like protein
MADAAVKAKTMVQMKMSGTCPTHARTDITVRDVETVVDEPKERGGTNLGPTPTEMLLAALISCSNVVGQRLAHREGIEFESLSIDAEAVFDRRGPALIGVVDVPFVSINLTMNVTTSAPEDKLDIVKRDLPRYCPIETTLRNSGTKIETVWNVTRP